MTTRTHTVRLLPSAAQEAELLGLMRLRNVLWNSLLTLRNKHYEETGKGLSDFDLMSSIPKLKLENPELKNYNSKAAQVVVRQIGSSFRSFFALRKNGYTDAQPPGLVNEDKWVSITYNQSGWKFKENGKATFDKLSSPIPYLTHLTLFHKTKLKEIRIKYVNRKWLCDVVIDSNDQYGVNNSNKTLALDLGLKTLATGIDSDGKVVRISNRAKRISQHFEKQIAKIDKKLSTRKKGSNRYRRLRRTRRNLFNRKNAQTKQTLHIQSKRIANMNYHTVVLGDLSVKELMKKETKEQAESMTGKDKAIKRNVRKSFQQSAIDTFRDYLTYKCQGRTNIIELDERNTTQTNCLTGKKFPMYIDLTVREVQLTDTLIIDRDLNSAVNILKRWEKYHLAALTPPLDAETLLRVLEENNLFEQTRENGSQEPPKL